MYHVLGIATVVSQGLGAVGLCAWLRYAARNPYTWQRPVRAPKLAEGELVLMGDDYGGLI